MCLEKLPGIFMCEAVFFLSFSSFFLLFLLLCQISVAALPSLGIRPHFPVESWVGGHGEPQKTSLPYLFPLLSLAPARV